MFNINFCQGPLALEATTLPNEPPPLPKIFYSYFHRAIELGHFKGFIQSKGWRTFTKRGKYHCAAHLLFDWFGFNHTSKADVNPK